MIIILVCYSHFETIIALVCWFSLSQFDPDPPLILIERVILLATSRQSEFGRPHM